MGVRRLCGSARARLQAFVARRVVWLLAALVCLGAAGPALALQLTDDRGVVVTLAAPPQRIVSLLPSLTETVCELGQC